MADPVEQDLWLKNAAGRLAVDEGAIRRSLASHRPISASRLEPRAGMHVSREKNLLGWILCCPEAVALQELEECVQEFENQELKELLEVIIASYREYGRLDHSLLVQQVETDRLRQQICALTLEEKKFDVPSADLFAADWRRDLEIRRLKKTQARLEERLRQAASSGDEELAALLAQRQEIDRQLEALKISTTKGEIG
jgi:hypothetical protein